MGRHNTGSEVGLPRSPVISAFWSEGVFDARAAIFFHSAPQSRGAYRGASSL